MLFQIRNKPPKIKIKSRPEMSLPNTLNKGSTKPTMKDNSMSKPMRMNMAMNRPMRLASSRFSGGNLSTKMEMKMMLSMPSTSSSAVRVAKAIQACGSVKSSMRLFQ